MSKILVALCCIGLFGGTAAHAADDDAPSAKKKRMQQEAKKKNKKKEPLPMDQGTVELGGSATLDLLIAPDFSLGLNLAPRAGYFIGDQLELYGSPQIGVLGIGSGGDPLVTFGLGAGVQYFIDAGSNWFYVGGELEYGRFSIDIPLVGSVSVNSLSLNVPAGVLIPLARNVGLDVGGRIEIGLPIEEGSQVSIGVPMGYLGVRAFIP